MILRPKHTLEHKVRDNYYWSKYETLSRVIPLPTNVSLLSLDSRPKAKVLHLIYKTIFFWPSAQPAVLQLSRKLSTPLQIPRSLSTNMPP